MAPFSAVSLVDGIKEKVDAVYAHGRSTTAVRAQVYRAHPWLTSPSVSCPMRASGDKLYVASGVTTMRVYRIQQSDGQSTGAVDRLIISSPRPTLTP